MDDYLQYIYSKKSKHVVDEEEENAPLTEEELLLQRQYMANEPVVGEAPVNDYGDGNVEGEGGEFDDFFGAGEGEGEY